MNNVLNTSPSPGNPGSYADTTVILPTFNENGNIRNILTRLSSLYPECRIIVADDGSRDGTRESVRGVDDPHLRLLDRDRRDVHGLTVSVLDAAAVVDTKFFIVMDADGQHPVETVGAIVDRLRSAGGLVIARRKDFNAGWTLSRRIVSFCGDGIGKIALWFRGKNYFRYDILSGFFGCEKSFWDNQSSPAFKMSRFQLRGYKVLFDFLKYLPAGQRISEVDFRFETRQTGTSKISLKVYVEYIKSCLSF